MSSSAELTSGNGEHERLRGIAIWEIRNGHHGDFLVYFLETYLRADLANERLLRPLMAAMVNKYRLHDYERDVEAPDE